MANHGLGYQYYKYITAEAEERTVKCSMTNGAIVACDLDAPDMTKRPFPASLARKAYVQDQYGRTRTLIVGSPTAFGALDGTFSVSLPDPGSATLEVFNFVGKHPEGVEKEAHLIVNQ